MRNQPNEFYDVSPLVLGAKPCPHCKDSELKMEFKSIAYGATFAEVTCLRCNRTALSEIHPRNAKCIQQAIDRWNSIWPDISRYLDSTTEGVKIWMN